MYICHISIYPYIHPYNLPTVLPFLSQTLTSVQLNGAAAYIPYINKLTFTYQPLTRYSGGTSTGVNAFLMNRLLKFAHRHPYVSINQSIMINMHSFTDTYHTLLLLLLAKVILISAFKGTLLKSELPPLSWLSTITESSRRSVFGIYK